jgi:hypothetical protein
VTTAPEGSTYEPERCTDEVYRQLYCTALTRSSTVGTPPSVLRDALTWGVSRGPGGDRTHDLAIMSRLL